MTDEGVPASRGSDTNPLARTPVELSALLAKRIVLSVGVSQGRIVDETDDTTRSKFFIRRAGEVVPISEPAYALWRWTLVPRSVEEFEARSNELSGSNEDSQLHAQELERLNLVTAFGPAQSEWNAVAEKLRPIPLGFGIGNSESEIPLFTISSALGEPMVQVDPLGFWIWLTWDGTLSIGEGADQLASTIPEEVTRSVILRSARELTVICVNIGLIVLDGKTV